MTFHTVACFDMYARYHNEFSTSSALEGVRLQHFVAFGLYQVVETSIVSDIASVLCPSSGEFYVFGIIEPRWSPELYRRSRCSGVFVQ